MRKFLDKTTGYFTVKVIMGFLVWFYFRVVHRRGVEIIGKGNIPRSGKVLFYANHPSMVDPIIISCLFFPRCIFRPGLWPPFTLAAAENFFPDDCRDIPWLKKIPYIRDSRLFAWLMRHANTLPVREGRKDPYVLRSAKRKLRAGSNVFIFPEGARTKNGVLDEFKEGVAFLAMSAKKIIPIWIEGSEKVFPKGKDRPQWSGNKITIMVGEPLKSLKIGWWHSLWLFFVAKLLFFVTKKEKREELIQKMDKKKRAEQTKKIREELLKLRPKKISK